jgi:glycosyltransferase involved in cell wall biosynthesis
MDMFNKYLGVPYSRSSVLENAIEPIEYKSKPSRTDGIVRIIYHTTPHRGLELIVPVFEKLCEKHDNIQLDVYSSFKIYGWGERDAQYEALFERCKNHPKINYHGSVPNTQIRAALQDADIFAYPSIWVESSCISIMEAMSAGVICVHPNYGALYETTGCLTRMYGWHEDVNEHAGRHLAILDATIEDVKAGRHIEEANYVKSYADLRFNWKRRAYQWQTLLEKLKTEKPASKFITLKS